MEEVKISIQKKIIPTYEVGKPDKNPMFLEKRVYQGSSGKVYPIPVIDKIYDKKIDKEYEVIILENRYLEITILPELGGRIQRALDKTNNYDFVYHNRVIKPALVGLAGPWISGGIEFNWPQHHRPSTFSPVEYVTKENSDGSKTVWISEIDVMYGTKGMAGFTLYPDKAFLEIKGQLYNGTLTPQTFLWWANPAVAVNDYTKSVFPPDVNAVFDHGKRDVSRFPIATGEYYKVDYSKGVDIGRYKNIPVPTSYMAYHSDFNFVGGYDYSVEAGILHVADHHVSPGKKQWTWGHGDFGQAWDRNLTDEDGPYIELMTGVFTDNQPDFTWLQPYETKNFTQYFMPYKGVGEVKNANINGALNFEISGTSGDISCYVTGVEENLKIKVKDRFNNLYFEEIQTLSPKDIFKRTIKIDCEILPHNYIVQIIRETGEIILQYSPAEEKLLETPEPAKPALNPSEIMSVEDLYLTGLHLEQYRHATYNPEDYYLEGLKRSPEDIRINNKYGLLLFRKGLFQEAEKHFKMAIKKLTWKNPNPYDGEPYYNLGLTLKMQGKLDEAYSAFYKATWNGAWQDSGFFALAQIANMKKNYSEALEFINRSLERNYINTKARALKSRILKNLERFEESALVCKETLKIDILDFAARFELRDIKELKKVMRDSYNNYLELAIDYINAGEYEDAIAILSGSDATPEIDYYKGYCYEQLGNPETAKEYYKKGERRLSDYCFPNKLHSINVFKSAINSLAVAPKAKYYLGCLFYDKKQHEKAISLWEESAKENEKFPTVFRNLALSYYNKLGKIEEAREFLEKAFELDTKDARVLFELDQLYKKIGISDSERAKNLHKYFELVEIRDDLYTEYVTLCNSLKKYSEALSLMKKRQFHPWEGGEGKITAQYIISNVEIGKMALNSNNIEVAIDHLQGAKNYPHNLGEGKLTGKQENEINYYLGCAYEALNDKEKADEFYTLASTGLKEPTDMMYYNDQPADTIFYQGLALRKLGKEDEARGRFFKLYSYGEKHLFDKIKIDYFAVSLPDFLVFEEDLDNKNRVHCRYLMGLGMLGLGDYQKALGHLNKAYELDKNHYGVKLHLETAKKGL